MVQKNWAADALVRSSFLSLSGTHWDSVINILSRNGLRSSIDVFRKSPMCQYESGSSVNWDIINVQAELRL